MNSAKEGLMELFDMHCHVDLMPDMALFAKQALVEAIGIFAVTTTPKAYVQETKMLRPFPNIRVGLGLHPQLVAEIYGEMALYEKHIADADYVGEIGLDFNRQFYASKEKQLDAFNAIVKWCGQYSGKVISIHSVHSDKMVLDILEKYTCTEGNKCILHWYSGTLAQLQRALKMGCYFSINGAMIKSANAQKLLANIPTQNLMIETDAPFVGEIKTITKLKTELKAIQVALSQYFGENRNAHIQNTSKTLLRL